MESLTWILFGMLYKKFKDNCKDWVSENEDWVSKNKCKVCGDTLTNTTHDYCLTCYEKEFEHKCRTCLCENNNGKHYCDACMEDNRMRARVRYQRESLIIIECYCGKDVKKSNLRQHLKSKYHKEQCGIDTEN